jgi:4,5-dihydroxyphthalate decarboxylase
MVTRSRSVVLSLILAFILPASLACAAGEAPPTSSAAKAPGDSAKLELTVATGQHERARPLAEGRVQAEGIKLTTLMFNDDGARHDRFLRKGDFDASELSFAEYIAAWDRGADFTAIPVFLNRRFRHSFVYVNTDAGIRTPKDLEGKKVGITTWANSAAVWVRGLLQHDYQVDLTKITWVSARPAPEGWTPPAGIKIVPSSKPGSRIDPEVLAKGEIDALIVPDVLSGPKISRLFPKYQEVEMDYFRRTGIFPISHVMGIRKAVLEKNPWVAASLFKAFQEAKKVAYEYADDPGHSNLVWYGAEAEREKEVFGHDPFPFGIEENRKVLEEFISYAVEQGLVKKRPTVEDLFCPGCRQLKAGK